MGDTTPRAEPMSRRFLLRLLAAAPPTEHVSDAELLRRFATTRDPAAFELLVRRHADAVWAACRRVSRSEADAEDAFQAAFLALIQKAGSVRGTCAGGWLHRVAVNAALKLRATRATSTEPAALDALPAHQRERDLESAAAVHEELALLRETERLPVVLCDLEGLSHADAAAALGWPVGTVAGRLSRARAKLRARLARRGFAPAGIAPVLVAPPHLVPAAVSLTTVAPPAVVSLAEGVLSAMRVAQTKFAVAVCAAVGLIALAGVGTALALAPQPAPPAAEPPAAEPPAPVADEQPPADAGPYKVDRKWDRQRPFPSAFPDVPELSEEYLDKFEREHVARIYEADSQLVKLQKAKLRVQLERLRREVVTIERYVKRPADQKPDTDTVLRALERLSEKARDTQTAAAELYPEFAGSWRAWLVLRVAAEKRVEAVFESRTFQAWRTDRDAPRLEAELQLAKYDGRKK